MITSPVKKTPPTIVLSILYKKIKLKQKGVLIDAKKLKQIIQRFVIYKTGEMGGDRKGISKVYIPDVIEDLINFDLIKKINRYTYEILPSRCTRRLKKFPY